MNAPAVSRSRLSARKCPRLKRALLLSAALVGTLGWPPANAAETFVLWTFETSLPNTAGPHLAEAGTGAASGFHADAAATYTHPAGNGSAASFNSNRWAIGDYYEFRLSAVGYQDLLLSWDQSRSGTGPALFDLAYSTNGADFSVVLDDYAVSSNSFSATSPKSAFTFTADLSRIAELNNAAQVWFRLIAAAVPGGTAGTSRVDNFKVSGSVFIPLYWAPASDGSTGTWDATTPHWTSDATGLGALREYESAHTAVLGGPGTNGAPRILHIASEGVTSKGGLRFESTGYLVQGGTLTLEGPESRISVTHPGDIATIDARIHGSSGLWKSGDGTLILGGENPFSGTVHITGGILSIAANSALGAASNPLLFNGGTLSATATVDLGLRGFSGKGALQVAQGARLSTSGDVDFESLTVRGGEVQLLGTLARTAALIVQEATSVRTVAGLRVGAGGIATQHRSGTARLEGGIDLDGNTRAITVADGSADVDLILTGTYGSSIGTGRYKLHKLGEGTLDLQAEGAGNAGLRIGTAGSLGTAISGGRVLIHSAAALGGSTLELNYGILEIAGTEGQPAPNLTGESRVLLDVSLGGIEGGGGAVIRGGNLEFLGNLSLFKPSGATVNHTLEIQNHTILSGALRQTNNPAVGVFTGLRLLGTGTFSLQSALNDFSDLLVVDGPTLEVNGTLAAPQVEVLRGSLTGKTQGGTLGLYGHVTIGDGLPGEAILSPGSSAAADRIGMLMLKGLTLLSDAVVRIELNSDLGITDQISLFDETLTITAGARLEILDLGSTHLPVGFELTIIDLPFAWLPEGSFDQQVIVAGPNIFEITYTGGDGNDVALRVIPEPASLLLLAVGVGLLGWRRAGHRRRIPPPCALSRWR